MHTQFLKVRQTGLRTTRVERELVIEVPFHISKSSQLLEQWIDMHEQGGEALENWYPEGTPSIHAVETTVLGLATQAEIPMTPEELALYDAGDVS